MRIHGDRLRRLRRLARLGLAREEIAEELRFHLSMEAARLVASGKTRAEAEHIALESFGDPRAIEMECRRIRGGKLEDAAFEIRSAVRTLASDRRVSSIAFAGLTIAIALLAIAFSLADATLFKPLPYSGADRIVRLWSSVPGIGADARWGIAKAQFQFFQRESRSLSQMGLYRYETVTARSRSDEKASQVTAMVTSNGTLGVLGVRPLLGHGFSPNDNLSDRPRVALLSYSAWERFYNRHLDVVGQTLEVDGSTVRIVGVLPQAISFPEEIENAGFSPPDVLLPLRLNPADAPQNNHVYRAVASLRADVDLEAAMQELKALVARLPDEMPAAYPRSFMKSTRFGVEVVPLGVEIQGGSVASFVTMLAAASLLLALACAAAWNAPARQPGERLSPFSTEMVLLVTASTTIALVLASILLRYSAQVMVVPTPGLTVRGGAFTLFIAAIAATFLVAIRSSKTPNDERRILPVVTQAAIALPLVMFAAMTIRDASDLKTTSPGFDVESTVATRIHLPATRYSSHHAVSSFEAALTERLRSVDGVESVGLTTSLPLTGFDGCSGVTVDNRAGSRCVPVYFVSPDYLRTLGVPISGRYAATSEEAVVSAAFARRTWPGIDPIGRTISLGPSAGSYRVVGVAADVRSRGLDREPADDVYMPMTPRGGLSGWPPITDNMLVVRSSHADKRVVRQLVLDAIQTIDGSVEAGATRTMSEIVAADTAHRNLPVSFISIAALAAIALFFTSVPAMMDRSRMHPPRRVQPVQALQLHDY